MPGTEIFNHGQGVEFLIRSFSFRFVWYFPLHEISRRFHVEETAQNSLFIKCEEVPGSLLGHSLVQKDNGSLNTLPSKSSPTTTNAYRRNGADVSLKYQVLSNF